VVKDDTGPRVQHGSRVRIQEADGVERVLLVRDDDEGWAVDSIHVDTPLMRALLGHRAGDEVEVRLHEAVPVRKVTVLSIENAGGGRP